MNNQAPELSPEARRIISAARGADDPTAEDQERVKARWLASIAAVAGVSSLTEAARAAGGMGWALKAAGTALVVAAGAVGLFVALPTDVVQDGKKAEARPGATGTAHGRFEKTSPGERREADNQNVGGVAAPAAAVPSPAAPEATVVALPVVVNPVSKVDSAPPAPSVLEPAEVPTLEGNALGAGVEAPVTGVTVPQTAPAEAEASARSGRRARSKAPVPPRATRVAAPAEARAPSVAEASSSAQNAATQNGQLGEELALLSDVRSSVQGGSPGHALELLGKYGSRFGQPILGMEAAALRVDALCKNGQRDAARASAVAFQSDWPNSPLKQRVSAACP